MKWLALPLSPGVRLDERVQFPGRVAELGAGLADMQMADLKVDRVSNLLKVLFLSSTTPSTTTPLFLLHHVPIHDSECVLWRRVGAPHK